MLKTYLYIPDEINERISRLAKTQKKSKAEVIRNALEKGIEQVAPQNNAGVDVLFKLAELGKKANFKGPRDSSTRMDELLWDKDWSKDE